VNNRTEKYKNKGFFYALKSIDEDVTQIGLIPGSIYQQTGTVFNVPNWARSAGPIENIL